jgi:DNA polymerase-4
LIAQEIRRRIWRETGLAASAGVAPNKFLAKVASDINKPNGLCVIPPSEVAAFMPQLKIEKIPGVGRVTARRMHLRGLRLCGDLQRLSEEQLIDDFGKWGRALYRLCRGEDHRPVEASFERKSLSVEETFPRDITRLDDLLGKMPELFMDWARRMERRDHRERIQGAFVKLKFCDFTATTVERRSLAPTQENFKSLFRTAWGRRNLPIRLAGLGARLGDPADGGAVEQLALPLSDCG